MAKLGKWQADVVGDPQGGGPLMVRSTNAGAVGRATAQMGRDLFQAGYMITREAREAEEKTRSLQRATEVSRFALEANKGFNQLKGDLSKEPDPDQHLPRFNEFASGQIERLSTIGDEETRNRAEIWLNDELGFWDKDISTNVPALRIKQTSQHIEAVTQNAIEDRNIELLETVGQDLVTEGFWSLQQYSDYHGQVDERISKELDKDVIAGEVLSMEPDAAVRHLKDRARPLHMTVQEWADYRDQLHARLDVNRAAAAQEQRAQTQLVHANDDQLITDALQGKLDLPAGIGLVQKQLASVEALDQARRIAIAGPAEKDDFDVLSESYAWLRKVREDPSVRPQGLKYVRDHAPQLKGETSAALLREIQTAATATDPMNKMGVKVADQLLDDHYAIGTFGDVDSVPAQQVYLNAKQELAAWARAHPDANETEVTTYFSGLVSARIKPSWWRRVAGALNPYIQSGTRGIGRGITSVPGAIAGEAGLPAALPEEAATYEVRDPSVEPLSLEEFYETVKTLPEGSSQQKEYYRKWASKWQ